jgi:hypothetical protein
MSALAKLALAMLAVAVSCVMTKGQAADSVVGTWRLVSWVEEETEARRYTSFSAIILWDSLRRRPTAT